MLQNTCRICAIDTDSTKVTKLFEKSARKLLRQINLLTGVFLEEKPDIPKVICNICQNDLDCAMKFRKRCLRNHKRWSPPLKPTSKTEPAGAEPTPVICVRQGARTRARCINEDEKVPLSPIEVLIKGEDAINNAKEEDDVKQLGTETVDTDEAENELLLPPIKAKRRRIRARCANKNGDKDEESNLSPTGVGNEEKYPTNTVDDDGVETETDSCDDNDETDDPDFSVPEPDSSDSQAESSFSVLLDDALAETTTLNKARAKPNIPVYFCDQCGNNVRGKSALDRHLLKHSGIRPFKCEHCPAGFFTSSELKGHQVSHTGARNFPCRYCEKSYANGGGRLRHERTHTNERPFACSQCVKTFTTSCLLKAHILVHTGERKFRCDLCDRSFSRPTHLKTHYRSNTHKQNVEKSSATQQQFSIVEEVQAESGISWIQDSIELPPVILLGLDVPLNGSNDS